MPGLLNFFFLLFYINMFTIGGGYVMIPLLQQEVVEHYHWLTNAEFIESIAIGQLTPGPLTIMNVFIGYKIFGLAGSVVALIGSYLPSIIIVTIVSKYYNEYKSSRIVDASFRGIKPAVIGLLASVSIKLAETAIIDIPSFIISGMSFSLIAFTKIDPTFVILGAGVAGILIY